MTDPAVNVRAAFRELTLGLMSWAEPPAAPWERSEPASSRGLETHYGREEYVDPFDVETDWEERA